LLFFFFPLTIVTCLGVFISPCLWFLQPVNHVFFFSRGVLCLPFRCHLSLPENLTPHPCCRSCLPSLPFPKTFSSPPPTPICKLSERSAPFWCPWLCGPLAFSHWPSFPFVHRPSAHVFHMLSTGFFSDLTGGQAGLFYGVAPVLERLSSGVFLFFFLDASLPFFFLPKFCLPFPLVTVPGVPSSSPLCPSSHIVLLHSGAAPLFSRLICSVRPILFSSGDTVFFLLRKRLSSLFFFSTFPWSWDVSLPSHPLYALQFVVFFHSFCTLPLGQNVANFFSLVRR